MAFEWSYPLILPSGGQAPKVGADFSGNETGILYRQLALDSLTGDVAVPMRWLIGPPAVVQRMKIRASIWLGEWFLDLRVGVPYREVVLVHSPDLTFISAMFRELIASTPGVKEVRRFSGVFDRPNRSYKVEDAEAVLEDGAVVIMTDEPFIFSRLAEVQTDG